MIIEQVLFLSSNSCDKVVFNLSKIFFFFFKLKFKKNHTKEMLRVKITTDRNKSDHLTIARN